MKEHFAGLRRSRVAGATIGILVASIALTASLVAMRGGAGDQLPPRAAAEETAIPLPSTHAGPTATPEASPTPIKHAGILDGMPMSDGDWEARKDTLPIAVMLDNSQGAIPHVGLNRADLVYEAFVEGGITRLMAVFWRQDADKIMPVRSARTPFVVWASELGALYGHAGGASTDNDANALGQIVEWGIRDLNAFGDIANTYYFRDETRPGPFDLATTTYHLREAAARLGFAGTPSVESWRFREPGTRLPAGAPAHGIEVDFHNRLYPWQYIQWRWDAGARRYFRFQFGGPQLDGESGEQLAFATVIVMTIGLQVVDEHGHVVLEQVGDGEATIFTGGQAYPGAWKKESRKGRTRYFGLDGQELVFERGPIFIEVLSSQSAFSYLADGRDLPEMPEYVPLPPGFGAGEDQTPTPTEGPPETPSSTPIPSPTAPATPTPGTPTATPTPTIIPSPTIDPTLMRPALANKSGART